MSHLPDQPHEVPYREVEHQDPFDDAKDGFDFITGIGKAEHTQDWMTDERVAEWELDLNRREEARRALKGFGFCVARVNG